MQNKKKVIEKNPRILRYVGLAQWVKIIFERANTPCFFKNQFSRSKYAILF